MWLRITNCRSSKSYVLKLFCQTACKTRNSKPPECQLSQNWFWTDSSHHMLFAAGENSKLRFASCLSKDNTSGFLSTLTLTITVKELSFFPVLRFQLSSITQFQWPNFFSFIPPIHTNDRICMYGVVWCGVGQCCVWWPSLSYQNGVVWCMVATLIVSNHPFDCLINFGIDYWAPSTDTDQHTQVSWPSP